MLELFLSFVLESGVQFSSFKLHFFACSTCFWSCAVLIYRVLLANFNSITIDFATLEVWRFVLAFHLQGCCSASIRARLPCHVVLPSAPVSISIISGAALYALMRIVHSDSTLIPLLSFHFPPLYTQGQVIGLWHRFLLLPVIFESVPGRATSPRVALQR